MTTIGQTNTVIIIIRDEDDYAGMFKAEQPGTVSHYRYAAHCIAYLESLLKVCKLTDTERASASGYSTSTRSRREDRRCEDCFCRLLRPIPRRWFEALGGDYAELEALVLTDQAAYDAIKDNAAPPRIISEPTPDRPLRTIQLPDEVVEETDIVEYLSERSAQTGRASFLYVGGLRTYRFYAHGYMLHRHRPTMRLTKALIEIKPEQILHRASEDGGDDTY